MKKKYLNLEFCHDLSAPNMKNCGMHHKSDRDCSTFHQHKENRSWSGFMVKWKLCVLFSHFSRWLLMLKGERTCATLKKISTFQSTPPWGSVGSWSFFACQGDRKVQFMFFLGYSLMDLSLYRIWTIWTFLGCAAWISFPRVFCIIFPSR